MKTGRHLLSISNWIHFGPHFSRITSLGIWFFKKTPSITLLFFFHVTFSDFWINPTVSVHVSAPYVITIHLWTWWNMKKYSKVFDFLRLTMHVRTYLHYICTNNFMQCKFSAFYTSYFNTPPFLTLSVEYVVNDDLNSR